MEVSTTIAGMIRGNQIVVPDYQRAYSPSLLFRPSSVWENWRDGLCRYRWSVAADHDSHLFNRIRECRGFSDEEQDLYEDIIKRRSTYKFSTVKYDNQLFKDYVIDQTKKAERQRKIVDFILKNL